MKRFLPLIASLLVFTGVRASTGDSTLLHLSPSEIVSSPVTVPDVSNPEELILLVQLGPPSPKEMKEAFERMRELRTKHENEIRRRMFDQDDYRRESTSRYNEYTSRREAAKTEQKLRSPNRNYYGYDSYEDYTGSRPESKPVIPEAKKYPEVQEYALTPQQRKENRDYLAKRLHGDEYDGAYHGRHEYPDADRPRDWDIDQRAPHYDYWQKNPDAHTHNGRRCVRYPDQTSIPESLLAAGALRLLELNRVETSPYGLPPSMAPRSVDIPNAYRSPNAYELSYAVDKKARVSMDDILFSRGSSEFADDYSRQAVLDVAYAMQQPQLAADIFVVEGHASAEGGYDANLRLSQRRAERIVQEIVQAGVSPDRLIPIGYGESEAFYPDSADEYLRRFDRKVVIYRLQR